MVLMSTHPLLECSQCHFFNILMVAHGLLIQNQLIKRYFICVLFAHQRITTAFLNFLNLLQVSFRLQSDGLIVLLLQFVLVRGLACTLGYPDHTKYPSNFEFKLRVVYTVVQAIKNTRDIFRTRSSLEKLPTIGSCSTLNYVMYL